MRYMGIDFGTKRLGIAVSDDGGEFAFPRGVLPNNEKTFDELRKIIELENIGVIVIGDTLTVDGSKNLVTSRAREFMSKLDALMGVTVHRMREAYSSAEAMRYAPAGQRHDDSAAAAIILQRFLDARQK